MKRILSIAIIFMVLTILSSPVNTLLADDPVHWAYTGPEGPEHWGELAPEFELCASGTEQSPVDIPATAPLNPADISFDYKAVPLVILNNGHSIQVNYEPGSSMIVGGKTYNLLQLHFHVPSEHELHGESQDMELHFVHQADDGEFAVLGVMLEVGAENSALKPVFDNLPADPQPATPVENVTLDANAMLPDIRTYYRYDGSFTSPPCTESVKWHVLNEPIEISEAQLEAFNRVDELSARPVQPLNDRTFYLVSTMPRTGGNFELPNLAVLAGGAVLVLGGVGLIVVARRRKE